MLVEKIWIYYKVLFATAFPLKTRIILRKRLVIFTIKIYLRVPLNNISAVMKKDIHPDNYRLVVFKDISNDEMVLTRSCANSRETITWEDGNEYPLIKVEISSFSHPFFTGKMKFVDTAGRIDKFNKKFAKFNKKD